MKEFDEALFKTKVDNVFVKLFTAIMFGDLKEVDHFINDDVYNKYNSYIKELDSKNERQMYDELNVKSTTVLSREKLADKEIVKVELISRYMDYIIDKDTGDYKRGINDHRIEKKYILTFEKKLDAKNVGIVRKCPNCGASMDINKTGVCEYCKTVYKLEDYDYILTSIE